MNVGLLVDKHNTHNTYKCRYAINYSLSVSLFNIVSTLCVRVCSLVKTIDFR